MPRCSRRSIIALGAFAARTLLKTQDPISRLRGRVYDYRGAQLIPTFHPSFLLRSPGYKREAWEDLKKALALLGRQPPTALPQRARSGPMTRVSPYAFSVSLVGHLQQLARAPHPRGRARALPRGAHLSAFPTRSSIPVVGARVLVPLGKRIVTGVVTGHAEQAPAGDDGIKAVVDVLDGDAFLPAEIVSLALWVAEYYACGAGEAIGAAMPPRAWIESERHARITDAGHARMLLERGARRDILEQLRRQAAASRRLIGEGRGIARRAGDSSATAC